MILFEEAVVMAPRPNFGDFSGINVWHFNSDIFFENRKSHKNNNNNGHLPSQQPGLTAHAMCLHCFCSDPALFTKKDSNGGMVFFRNMEYCFYAARRIKVVEVGWKSCNALPCGPRCKLQAGHMWYPIPLVGLKSGCVACRAEKTRKRFLSRKRNQRMERGWMMQLFEGWGEV